MTVNEIYQSGLKLLENNNIENSKFEAQSLLQKAFSLDRVGFIMHKTDKADENCSHNFLKFIEKRISGEPLQYILGEWSFMGFDFKVGRGVLIPRDDTIWAIILPMTVAPFYIFLLRQYMVGLPGEMIEAAQIDGAGTFRCFIHVVLPVCQPILGAAVALSFADCWNLVEQPLTYLTTHTELYPLSVVFNQLTQQSTGVEFAGAALYTLPALLIYLYFQNDILEGVQLTELK